MAKACDGFTIGTILAAINEVDNLNCKYQRYWYLHYYLFNFIYFLCITIQVMTTKRMVQLRTHPLTHAELVNALSFKDPIYREEEDAFLGL